MLKILLFIFGFAVDLSVAASSGCHGPAFSAANLTTIDPNTATCDGAPYLGECANATEAAPWIDLSFRVFQIESFGTQAALLSLMLYETASFKYKINHYPGVPGQGTRNMQSPAYNLKYAQWLAANESDSGVTEQRVGAANAEGPKEVLALVNNDRWGFASAAWFLTTQCDERFREGLAAETEEGWNAYLTDCVGTTATEDRTAIWKKAIALGEW